MSKIYGFVDLRAEGECGEPLVRVIQNGETLGLLGTCWQRCMSDVDHVLDRGIMIDTCG